MAMLAEHAGGRASNGRIDVMDIVPETLHQRIPLYIGSREFVDIADSMLAQDG
jgi:fructose-1,6-bisphosphatase I